MGLHEVPLSMWGFGVWTMLANFHILQHLFPDLTEYHADYFLKLGHVTGLYHHLAFDIAPQRKSQYVRSAKRIRRSFGHKT